MYEVFEQLLLNHGITAYKVSKDTGIPQTTFSTWKAKRHILNSDTLKILAEYFNVSVDYLITGVNNSNKGGNLEAKNKTERDMLVLCRSLENIPEDEKDALINNFKSSIDIFLKAKGLK